MWLPVTPCMSNAVGMHFPNSSVKHATVRINGKKQIYTGGIVAVVCCRDDDAHCPSFTFPPFVYYILHFIYFYSFYHFESLLFVKYARKLQNMLFIENNFKQMVAPLR